MDATQDVIIGTAKGYGWSSFKNYAVSLSESGFRGRKILFVCDITDVARDTLIRLGFELVDYVSTGNNTVIERFRIFRDWLAANKQDIRYIIHCDIRDVVVQSDPSPWMEKQTAKLFGASEFILYKNEFCNPAWIMKLYGQATLDTLQNEEVICAGTIAGEADAVHRLVSRIYESCTDRFGDDQAALNVLLRTEFKDEMVIPRFEDAFIATVGWWLIGGCNGNPDQRIGKHSMLADKPPVLINGKAYVKNECGQDPICIIHQYERGNAWRPSISERYKLPWTVPNDASDVKPATRRRRGGPVKYAKDGLTIDWFDAHDIG
jgi:hypothetical protein